MSPFQGFAKKIASVSIIISPHRGLQKQLQDPFLMPLSGKVIAKPNTQALSYYKISFP
jgi:hypothetical protein